MNKPAAQFIQPPNTLRLKVGGSGFGIDAAAVARAEAALKDLSSQFGQWLNDEVSKLEAARAEVRMVGVMPQTMDQLYMRAHDLKGLGATYEYPIVTRIAGSLCKLIETEVRMKAPLFLIDAHIDAIKAVVRDGIQTDDHPMGGALAVELERKTKDHLASL